MNFDTLPSQRFLDIARLGNPNNIFDIVFAELFHIQRKGRITGRIHDEEFKGGNERSINEGWWVREGAHFRLG
jgi:hypothetical protein